MIDVCVQLKQRLMPVLFRKFLSNTMCNVITPKYMSTDFSLTAYTEPTLSACDRILTKIA